MMFQTCCAIWWLSLLALWAMCVTARATYQGLPPATLEPAPVGDVPDAEATTRALPGRLITACCPYLHSPMAYNLLRILPDADRQAHGQELMESALLINPYNLLLVNAGAAVATTPQARSRLWESFKKALATPGNKPGGPTDGLYVQTVPDNLFKGPAKSPVAANKKTAVK